ncbi:hypothetical protein H7F33_01685 [Pedobacter sp. PAMC26386]|nr:hypothetical protein H7F33_01685 [Pedobacter sp. PAMC26386]
MIQILKRVIFWVSILTIISWIIIALFGKIIPLEIKIGKSGGFYMLFVFYGLQTAVIFTLFGTLKQNDSKKLLIGKILITGVVAAIACFVAFISVFSGMCLWNTDHVLFEYKDNPNNQIVLRRKSCGPEKGIYPIYKTCKVNYITSSLFWIKDIDTAQIDEKMWKRIHKNQ